jgi:hypothetical protein
VQRIVQAYDAYDDEQLMKRDAEKIRRLTPGAAKIETLPKGSVRRFSLEFLLCLGAPQRQARASSGGRRQFCIFSITKGA